MIFTTIWEVQNAGDYHWDQNSVDYLYRGGAYLSAPPDPDLFDTHDIPKLVDPKKAVNLEVEMQAPITPGSYTTTWMLHVGEKYFCTMRLTITVQ